MPAPRVGLSLMLEADFLRAAFPLFADGAVEILEWSFDVGWPPAVMPAWAEDLLRHYSDADQLLGHGVSYSALSAGVEAMQRRWLDSLDRELSQRRYRHLSEHFGFSATANFHQSAPFPVPLTAETLRLGQDRLQKLRERTHLPIGLENLAFAFHRQDVDDQGRFLEALLEPVDGFLLLDLHNLYCQSCNFGVSLDQLLTSYPLHRVRELHVAGGSWSVPRTGLNVAPVRRDTHDGAVPEELFDWLPTVLARCPNVEAVILERMGGTLTPDDDEPFRSDYRRLREVVHASRR
jgi:uncharacterized protein (UPF0276 family)